MFIEIGAADGYYSVGCISQGLFLKSYYFEISESGRDVILANDDFNGVLDKVIILGAADAATLAKISHEGFSRAVVLVDIEESEFDFIDKGVLGTLAEALVVIEIHDWSLGKNTERLVDLKRRIQSRFDLTEICTGARDLSNIPEVEKSKRS